MQGSSGLSVEKFKKTKKDGRNEYKKSDNSKPRDKKIRRERHEDVEYTG